MSTLATTLAGVGLSGALAGCGAPNAQMTASISGAHDQGTSAELALSPDAEPLFPLQWNLERIHAKQAWQRATGKGVVIAVIDSGIFYEHPEFATVDGTSKFVPGTTIFRSAPVIDDPSTYRFLLEADEPCERVDCVSADGAEEEGPNYPHGTAVASAAAAPVNGYGMAGVAPDAQVMSVRVIQTNDSSHAADTADGIRWAVDHGANVINLSLGYPQGFESLFAAEAIPDFGIADAVQYARERGVVVVAAAGNDSYPLCSEPAFIEGMICATATDVRGLPANYSNGGVKPDGLTVAAPVGSNQISDAVFLLEPANEVTRCEDQTLLATYYGEYAVQQAQNDSSCPPVGDDIAHTYGIGTSFAAPQVAGLAALLFEMGCTSEQAIDLILGTAQRPSPAVPEEAIPYYGHGIIDANAATLAAEAACRN